MPEKDPTTYTLITYAWVVVLSAWGGAVSFFRKVRRGVVRVFSITEFIGELVTSAFVGVITFWMCEAAGFDSLITAAMVGIAGHMGSRGVFALERVLVQRLGASVPPDEKPRDP